MKKTKLVASTLLLVLCCIAIWCLDVSVSALMYNAVEGEDAMVLSNGFEIISPAKMYHIAIFAIIISVFCLALITISAIVKEPKGDNQEAAKGGDDSGFCSTQNPLHLANHLARASKQKE